MNSIHEGDFGDSYDPLLITRPSLIAPVNITGFWEIVCKDEFGNIKWEDTIENLVVNAGLDYILDAGLSGGTPITSWFVGLTDGTPTIAAADTMASHVGWTEVTAYSEATRVAWTDGGVSGQSVDNSGSVASFSIDTNSTTIGGAFLVSDSTKGGTAGTLYAVGAFTVGDKSADNGDTLEVTATFTGSSS